MRRVPLIPVVLLVVLWFAPPAGAAATCNVDGTTVYISLPEGETVTISVDVASGLLLVDGVTCHGAPNDPAWSIHVFGPGGNETVTLDDSAAVIRPSMQVDLTSAGGNRLSIVGSDLADDIAAGDSGLSIDGTTVRIVNVETIDVAAGLGNDVVSASGLDDPDGRTPPLQIPITIHGGEGDDTLTGGDAGDRLFGDAGNDTLEGGAGTDLVIGGPDTDTCILESGQPFACDPAIELDPPSVRLAGAVDVTGTGWLPENGAVEVMLGIASPETPVLATATPTDQGTITASFTAPTTATTYSITACHLCPAEPGVEVTDPVDLVVFQPGGATPSTTPPIARSIELIPSTARPGATVKVRGQGWDPTAGSVHLSFQSAGGAPIGAPITVHRVRGSFHKKIVVPDVAVGSYLVVACQRCDPTERSATAVLTVAVPGSSAPWPWIAGAVLVGAAVAAARGLRRRRRPSPEPEERVECTTRMAPPTVELLVAPDDSIHHTIRLVPHSDRGEVRVKEMSEP